MQQNKEGEDSSGARPDGLPDCRVLDLMPSAVVVVDQEGGILRMNSCFCEVFGYATRTLRQKGLAGLIDAESVQECLHQQQYSGFARGVRARRKDVVFVVRSRRVSTQKGSYVVVDIQEQNDEYRVVFDDSPDAMFVHDLKGNFLDVNEMACRRLGYSRSELLQMGPKQIDAPGYVENYSDLISELKKEGYVEFRGAHVSKSGVVIPSEMHSKIISRQDRPAVLTVARDITARRSMERLIATRLEHQRVLADLSGKLVDATVHTLDQVISKGIEQLGRILDADRAYIFSYASDAKSVSNTHEWCGAGIPSQRSHLQNIPVEEIISIDQRMKNKDEIWIEAVEDLPAGAQKDHLHKQGIAALAVVPQFHGEQLLGFLGVDVLEGRRKWTEEDVSLLRFFAGVISNAMERCRAEQELAESRQRYKHLFERMVDGFALHKMIYDDGKAVDYRFLEVNPAFESLLGKKAEEIVGRKVSEIMPEANPEWVEDYATVIRTGRPLRIVREQSGRSYEVYVYRAEKGQFATIVRDTTESRKTEQRLKENEERYQLAMRGTSDGMWDWDISTDHLYLSPRWKQMLGYRDDELENTFTTWQKLLSPEDKERCEQYVKEYLAGKQKGKFHLEFRLMHKNGVPVHVLSRALMVKNRNGKPVRMVGTHIDMTERKKQEQEIRKFKRVLDNANYGVGIIDRQGRLQYVNEYFAKIHGYSLAYVKGRRVADVFHAKDQKQMIEAVNARVLQEGGVSGIEVEHRRKDGSRFPMLMSFVLLKDKDGRPEGIAATALDISARKEMEEQLRDSNAFLEQVLDSISDPVFIKDQQHRWIMCNEAFASFVGKERGELIGKTDYDFFPEEEADVFWERDDAVFRTGRVDVAEERFTDQRGDIHWISTKKSCFELECGDKILTGIIRDLTERRNIENHQRRLTTAMNQASETIVVTDVSGAIVYVNPSFEATTGYAGKDVIGENPRILKSGEQGAAFYEEMWQIISSGETWKGEFVNRRKDGSLYVEEATITPIFDEKGQIMNYLAIKYDITDKKQAEQQMRRRLEYEEVIAGISGMLLGSIHADYPLREAISLVRRVSGANSAVLILNVGERDLCMHEEYRVQGEGCRIRPSKKDRKYADGFARWQHLLEAKDIITGSVSSFPEEERRILRRRGVQSLLALPVFSEKRWGGAMVLESSKEDYAWGAEDIRMMQTVADMIGAFVASRQTHEELWDKMQMLESFRNATVDQILDMERLEKENAALKKRLEEGGA